MRKVIDVQMEFWKYNADFAKGDFHYFKADCSEKKSGKSESADESMEDANRPAGISL